MSDPKQVPPTPGTAPRVSRHGQRPYREDAAIYARHREAGTHPYTDDEVEARIVANAADAATMRGDDRLDVPFLRELIGIFRHRLQRDLPLDAEQRIRITREGQRAAEEAELAEAEMRRHGRRRRELESVRQRMPRPVGGAKFSHPAWLAACLLPAAAIEFLGSVAALEAAFKLSWLPASIFAVSISVILIIAADQFGITLASITRTSRRWAIAVIGLLVVVAVGSGIWAIATLAESRAANTAYKSAGERQAESSTKGLGAAGGSRSASRALEAVGKASDERGSGGAQPDIGFFVPLSILILSAATLLAFRVEAASEWNGLDEELGETIDNEEAARVRREGARGTLREGAVPRDATANELTTYVQRQHALLVVWLERFQAEYQRFCTLEEEAPRELAVPQAPDPADVLAAILGAHTEGGPSRSGPRPTGPGQGAGPSSGADAGGSNAGERPPHGPPREPKTEPPAARAHTVRGRRRRGDGRPPGM